MICKFYLLGFYDTTVVSRIFVYLSVAGHHLLMFRFLELCLYFSLLFSFYPWQC